MKENYLSREEYKYFSILFQLEIEPNVFLEKIVKEEKNKTPNNYISEEIIKIIINKKEIENININFLELYLYTLKYILFNNNYENNKYESFEDFLSIFQEMLSKKNK